MGQLFRRLKYLLNRRRFDAELANDMEFHREMASRAGGVGLGNMLRLREEARDAWGWIWIERLSQDLRYAARKLRKSPGFALAAVLMLAIGIGVNVAAFSFFNLIFLKPLPVHNPDTLLRFKRRAPTNYASQMPYAEMAFLRQHSRTLSAVIAVSEAKLNVEGENSPLTANFVTANFFHELDTAAILGRTLDPVHDEDSGAQPVVVLSEGFWRRHLGASAAIIGQTILLNNKPAAVIGVMPFKFSGLSMSQPDLWAPVVQQPYFITGSHFLTDFSVEGQGVTMFGRLRPNQTPAAAESELLTLAAELHRQHPADIWEKESLPSLPGGYARNLGGGRRGTGTEAANEAYPAIAVVSALTLLILGVACSNLGSLLVARSIAREKEISIRVAIGAGKTRLIRQLFTESLLLAMLGSIAGLALGYMVLRGLMVMTETPAWLSPSPDWRVVVFATLTGFVSAVLFGLTPAFQAVRQRRQATTLRQVLIAVQVAGSCVLLIVAALLVRAFNHAVTVDPGFDYQQVISIDPGLATHGYSAASARTYLERLQNRLLSVPGIETVSMSSTAPLGNKKVVVGTEAAGRAMDIHMYGIDSNFFKAMKIPLLQGRNLVRGDERSVIISKSFALRWPTGDPLGRPFRIGETDYTVIGIAGSARLGALQDPDAVEAYYLAPEKELASMIVLVKAAGTPEGLLPVIASIARAVDPKVFPQVQLMKSSFNRKLQATKSATVSVSLLGLVALVLACLGIAGLLAYAISQRTKEIGIRMALGAKPLQVLLVALTQLTRPVSAGLLLGAAASTAISHLLRRQLYGISSLDPLAYILALTIFICLIALSALIPVRRALRIDPLNALRHD